MFEMLGVKYYEAEDLADLLKVKRSTALRYLEQGRLPARWIGGRWIINEGALKRWLDPSFWEGDNTRAVLRSLAILDELEKRGIRAYQAIKKQILEEADDVAEARAAAILKDYWASKGGKLGAAKLLKEAETLLKIPRKRKVGRPKKTGRPRKPGRPRKAKN